VTHDPAELCPQCQAGRLRAWGELTDEEREVARRLPAPARSTPEERAARRFCVRCWNEETGETPREA
jgi:hypothetical protein